MDDISTRTQFTLVIHGPLEKLDLLEKVFDGEWDDKPHLNLVSRPPGQWHRRDHRTLLWKGNLSIQLGNPGKVWSIQWVPELAAHPTFQDVEFHATMEIVLNPTPAFMGSQPPWHAPIDGFDTRYA